jgi:hypothetical protein
MQEGKSREVELKDDNPSTIGHLLLYLYTYQRPSFSAGNTVWRYLDLFGVADKYSVQSLRDVCIEWLVKRLAAHELPKRPLVNADFPNVLKLVTDLGSHLWSLEQPGSEKIREAYLEMVIRNHHDLLEQQSMRDFLDSCPSFSFQLIQKMRTRLPQWAI